MLNDTEGQDKVLPVYLSRYVGSQVYAERESGIAGLDEVAQLLRALQLEPVRTHR